MVDPADVAGEAQEFAEQLLLQRHRQTAAEHRAALGDRKECLNCEEPLTAGRFCDADCREDYERRVKAHQRR